MRKPTKKRTPKRTSVTLNCVRCGENKSENDFYVNRWSKVYIKQNRVPLCKKCIETLFEEYSYNYGKRNALFLMCAILNIPFLPERFENISKTNPPFTMSRYMRQLQVNQYKLQSFASSVVGEKIIDTNTGESILKLQNDVMTLHNELSAIKDKISK